MAVNNENWVVEREEVIARTEMWKTLKSCFVTLNELLELAKEKIKRDEGV